MTDPTPPTPEALAAALRLVLLAADYAASDRYYTQGYRPDGAAEPEKLRGLIALVEANLPAMATGPELLAALRPFADWWFAGVFIGPTDLHQQLGIAGMRAHQTLAAALDAGRTGTAQ